MKDLQLNHYTVKDILNAPLSHIEASKAEGMDLFKRMRNTVSCYLNKKVDFYEWEDGTFTTSITVFNGEEVISFDIKVNQSGTIKSFSYADAKIICWCFINKSTATMNALERKEELL